MAIRAGAGIVSGVVNSVGNARAAFGFQFSQCFTEWELGFAVGIDVTGGCKVLRQCVAFLTDLGSGQLLEVCKVRLVRPYCGRCRGGFAVQASRRRDIGENGWIAGGITMAGVARFGAARFPMASQTRIVDFDRSVVLAVASLARLKIVRIVLEKGDMRVNANNPAGLRMWKTGVTLAILA